ncbi:ATP-binding cassette domain-containing protein, partial [Coleofasciculus sp. FACHB-712]
MANNSHIPPNRLSEGSLNGGGKHLEESPDLVEADPKPPLSEIALLAASGLCKSFGGVRAVDNVEITVPQGSITGLIGPNGAGKTTLFNLLSNFIHPDKGRVIFDGEPIHSLQP